MNLRLRFILLIAGVILIPLLVMALSFTIFSRYVYPADPQDIVRNFNHSLDEVHSKDQIPGLINSLENAYFGIVIEKSGLIESDEPVSESRIPKMIIQTRPHTLADGTEVIIILGVNFLDKSAGIFVFIFIFSILAALTVFSLLIIRSINKSINILEAATGKIADGNLDFELETVGSDKLGSLSRSLDRMRKQIKMEYDRRNRFFMGVSHDLKTPLSSIKGYTDALVDGLSDNPETTKKYLGIIKNKSQVLEQRITQLIHYIELSNYDFQTGLENKAVSVYLKKFLKRYEEELGLYNEKLSWKIDISSNCLIPFNEELLGRALENLIQNGFKHGYKGSAVEISCIQREKILLIDVKNEGPSISREILPYIFEPLFRGDKSRKSDGFGLGLASVKSIIESHGWTISVDSGEDVTVFRINIPI